MAWFLPFLTYRGKNWRIGGGEIFLTAKPKMPLKQMRKRQWKKKKKQKFSMHSTDHSTTLRQSEGMPLQGRRLL